MARTAVMRPPHLASRPVMALMPRPPPAVLPMLKTRPPIATSTATSQPMPGSTALPSCWALSPETPMTRHTFSCTAMSTRIETRIAKAKAAPSWTVKLAVWVMKPGPMALVAMRNRAPRIAWRVELEARAAVGGPVWISPSGVVATLLPDEGSAAEPSPQGEVCSGSCWVMVCLERISGAACAAAPSGARRRSGAPSAWSPREGESGSLEDTVQIVEQIDETWTTHSAHRFCDTAHRRLPWGD